MAHIRAMHGPIGEPLTVYWAGPRAEQICEETGAGVLLIKDVHSGEVIGFERLSYRGERGAQRITIETTTVTN